jgi:hypothetical protein
MNGDHVLAILRSRVGREQAITAPAIALRMGWTPNSERVVRSLIEIHANGDWPGVLCAMPGTGYYFASNLEEIEEYRGLLATLKKAANAKLQKFDERVKAEGFRLEARAA